MRGASSDLREVILKGGGVTEWVWKGEPEGVASVDVVVTNEDRKPALRHVVEFRSVNQAFQLEDERIENAAQGKSNGNGDADFHYRFQRGRPLMKTAAGGRPRELPQSWLSPNLSILAQRKEPEVCPEITYLANAYSHIRLYREWQFGCTADLRKPQAADARSDRLAEDFSNLGLFLNRLRRMPKAKAAFLARLRDLYEGLTDFDVSIEGGTVQVFFTEGDFIIPAARLSDGSLRYLCLLAILCDPTPPPLIGLEEPELGLHPDLLPKLADLLTEASQRTQLIVTTRSDIIVDAFTERPEAIVVCEKEQGQTRMQRLDASALAAWLEKYRLGTLWTRGELGGNRW